MMKKLKLSIGLLFLSSALSAQNIKEINLKQNCSPREYNPKILIAPDVNKVHEDWIGSEVGTSYSFLATKKIETSNGNFLYGNLISPKGIQFADDCYIIEAEWQCVLE